MQGVGSYRQAFDGRGHDKAIIVVRVFSDQIHAPGGLEDVRRARKELFKSTLQGMGPTFSR